MARFCYIAIIAVLAATAGAGAGASAESFKRVEFESRAQQDKGSSTTINHLKRHVFLTQAKYIFSQFIV